MQERSRSHRGRHLIGWSAAVLAAVGTLGYAGQLRAARRDERAFPPPGRMVDIGAGIRLHRDVRGEGHGLPTVVLEAGLGSFSPNWHWVQESLVHSGLRVVAYDRAGLGWSDPSPSPRDAVTMAGELHTA